MISEKDELFLTYWEKNRDIENTFISKLMRGFPMALLFGAPIVLSVLVVRLFIPDWYYKISETSPGTFFTCIIAMLLVVMFYAYFRMQHKWEINDQLYQELKSKKEKQTTSKS